MLLAPLASSARAVELCLDSHTGLTLPGLAPGISLSAPCGRSGFDSWCCFSFPQAGRGWERCTDSTACICNGLHSTFPSLGCTKAAYEIVQTEVWSPSWPLGRPQLFPACSVLSSVVWWAVVRQLSCSWSTHRGFFKFL